MTDIHPHDARALAAGRELYLADETGLSTSVAEVQALAYRLGVHRVLHTASAVDTVEMRLLLTQISRAHASGLPRATRERIAAVLA